jgi:hypothetical protein
VQRRILQHVYKWARLSCALFAPLASAATVFSFDGSWNHPRWGTHCFGCFIDLIQRKIVDFTVIRSKVKDPEEEGHGF